MLVHQPLKHSNILHKVSTKWALHLGIARSAFAYVFRCLMVTTVRQYNLVLV